MGACGRNLQHFVSMYDSIRWTVRIYSMPQGVSLLVGRPRYSLHMRLSALSQPQEHPSMLRFVYRESSTILVLLSSSHAQASMEGSTTTARESVSDR
jgi:hypothetical protein